MDKIQILSVKYSSYNFRLGAEQVLDLIIKKMIIIAIKNRVQKKI